jgi:kynurenine formamidase
MDVYDLSHLIETGMPFFPGDPEPRVIPGRGAPPWQVSALELGTHTGTHIDAPSHRFPEGRAIADFPPAHFVRPGLVIPVAGLAEDEPVQPERLEPFLSRVRAGDTVVFATGWARYWGQPRYFRHPYLSETVAGLLVEAGVAIVGIDALNVDSTVQGTSGVHERLLGAEVLIVENLRGLDQLVPGRRYVFSFLPLPVRGGDGSPVRAVAWESDTRFV